MLMWSPGSACSPARVIPTCEGASTAFYHCPTTVNDFYITWIMPLETILITRQSGQPVPSMPTKGLGWYTRSDYPEH